MSKKQLDQSWTEWLHQNIQRGCNREELLGILLNNAFDIQSIRQAMGTHFPDQSPLALAAERRAPDPIDYLAVASPWITRSNSGAVRFETDKVQLYTRENFLTSAECDEIVAIINQNLRPSTITVPSADNGFRTSWTSDLALIKSATVDRLDEKIARAVGIRPSYSEDIQAQRYDVGGEFKHHTDYFEPGTAEYAHYAGARGNRTWTFMVYLTDVESGGSTHFAALDHHFGPAKGMAVAWNNLRPDGTVNPDTLHAGCPVTAGHKIIITKWFRERGVGAMLYENPA